MQNYSILINKRWAKFFLVLMVLMHASAHAISSPFNNDLHLKLADQPAAENTCLVQDYNHHFQQSGVLLSKDVVATSAHGMMLVLKDSKLKRVDRGAYVVMYPTDLFVIFDLKNPFKTTYKVKAIIFDNRYLETNLGDQHKYDIAFLKLESAVNNLEPPPLQQKINVVPETPLLVLSYGLSDMPLLKDKRGYYLFEWHTFYASYEEHTLEDWRSILLGAVHFKPDNKIPSHIDPNATEYQQRSYLGLINWHKFNKSVYALAAPGSSGAPVYLTNANGNPQHLIGIIMGSSDFSKQEMINQKTINQELANNDNLKKPSTSLFNFDWLFKPDATETKNEPKVDEEIDPKFGAQTLITPFYQLSTLPKKNNLLTLKLDSKFVSLLKFAQDA